GCSPTGSNRSCLAPHAVPPFTDRPVSPGQILTGGHMAFPKTLCRSALTVLAFATFAACERTPQQATAPTGPQFSRTAPTEQDPLLARVLQINQQLAASGQHVAIEALDFFTVGNGRPGVRLHQTPFRWVPNDPRRLADGTNITYIFDQSGGHTASGLTAAQTEAAVDAALATWS